MRVLKTLRHNNVMSVIYKVNCKTVKAHIHTHTYTARAHVCVSKVLNCLLKFSLAAIMIYETCIE